MITHQGTKRARSEAQLVADAKLRRAEVRAVLNGLDEAGLARTLDKEQAEWELSHDFVAYAVARFLGRRRWQALQQAGAYAAPALLAVSLFGGIWMGQSYLKRQINWYWTVRPFRDANILPHVLSVEAERALKPKDSFRECATEQGKDYCPEMVVVPATVRPFTMGSPPTERYHFNDESPQHNVTITQPFAVAKFELTFAEWDTCVHYGDCPQVSDNNFGRGKQRVILVSWDDARRYVEWLKMMTGKSYRLLSEAEYEYAARAGTDTAYPWGDEIGKGNANCNGCGSQWDGKQPAPVGSFAANEFGLYDMHGNVYEWVEDCYHENYNGAPTNGSAWITDPCDGRVVRAGSWIGDQQLLRSAYRFGNSPSIRDCGLGFRVGRTLTP